MEDFLDTSAGARAPLVLDHDENPLEEAAIDNLVEQFGGENRAVVKFYRVTRGEPDGLLEQVQPAEFDFLHLAKKYGRGTYRIKVFAPDPLRNGRLTMRMNQTESYLGEVDAAPAPSVMHVPASNGGDISRLGEIMITGFQELGKLIVQNQPKQPDMGEMLNNMVLMRQAMGLDNQPRESAGMDKMLGLLQQGIELGKELGSGGDGDGTSGFLKVAEKTLPGIAEIVAKTMENRAAQPAAPAPAVIRRALPSAVPALPPNAAPEIVANPQPASPTQENPQMFGMNRYIPFKPYLAQVADAVTRNPETDPYAYAVILLDNIGDMELSVLLGDAKLLNNLAEVEPRIGQQRAWWEELVQQIRELTTPENPGTVSAHVPDEQAPTNSTGSEPKPGAAG